MVQSNQSNQHTILPWPSFVNSHFTMCTFQLQSQLQSAWADCQHGSYLKRFVSWWQKQIIMISTWLVFIYQSYYVHVYTHTKLHNRFWYGITILILSSIPTIPRCNQDMSGYAIICCRNAWKTSSNRKFNFHFVEAKSWRELFFFTGKVKIYRNSSKMALYMHDLRIFRRKLKPLRMFPVWNILE